MHAHDPAHDAKSPPARKGEARTPVSRPVRTALVMVALVGGFYLLREHWNHVAGNWIYLLLLACPLMHLFHGHGGHGGPSRHDHGAARRGDGDARQE